MINGTQNIFYERNGRILQSGKRFLSKDKLEDVVQQIAAGSNRLVNEASPIVDARLQDGSRVNVVLDPIALDGPIVTIRKFSKEAITMEQLISWNSVSEEVLEFLAGLVAAGYNIFISGGTGSGKTTFLNALSQYIPKTERIITIEDNAELKIQDVPNLVRLEARNANVEGTGAVTIRDLIRSALRMRPDRIVVGEVRGEEAIDMLQALNTGHDGSLSTGHANSPQDMLSRLETMVLMGMELPLPAIQRQIASGIDLIVHLGRLRDRSRKVLEVSEILGYEDGEIRLKTLYKFVETGEQDGKIQGEWLAAGCDEERVSVVCGKSGRLDDDYGVAVLPVLIDGHSVGSIVDLASADDGSRGDQEEGDGISDAVQGSDSGGVLCAEYWLFGRECIQGSAEGASADLSGRSKDL